MREALQKLVDDINRFTGKDYQLDYNSQGWRLTLKNGSINVSSRLTANEMTVYLDAFNEGLHYGVKQAMER